MKKWVIHRGEVVFAEDLIPSEMIRTNWLSRSLGAFFEEEELFDSAKEAIEYRMVSLSEEIVKLMSERSKLADQLRNLK